MDSSNSHQVLSIYGPKPNDDSKRSNLCDDYANIIKQCKLKIGILEDNYKQNNPTEDDETPPADPCQVLYELCELFFQP